MASQIGRKLKVKRAGTTIAGVRTKSVTVNNEPVDITTDDDSGYRTLLEESGTSSIDMSVEGLTQDDTLIDKASSGGTLIEEYTIELPSGAKIVGDFRFNNLEVGAEYTDAITFTGEFQSTGSWTFTAAP